MTNFEQVVELVMQYGIARETAIEWAMSGPRKPVAWRVTGRDGHQALFLSVARAVEYGALHHGTIAELYE